MGEKAYDALTDPVAKRNYRSLDRRSQRFVSTVIISLTHRIHGSGTLPKTNMSPENWWLEDVFPIEIVQF